MSGIVTRVNSAYHTPSSLIPLRWGTSGTVFNSAGTGTNPFSVTSQDPNTNNFPVWYATAQAGIDGNFTIALTDGFTAPINLVFWEYVLKAAKWIRLGNIAALYQLSYDSTYTEGTIFAGENAIILVQTSTAVTGSAYTDGTILPAVIGPGLVG